MNEPDVTKKYCLHGWDDGKLYFWTEQGDVCVSEIPELMDQLEELCRKYFETAPERQMQT